jgi:hypothetical protein
VNIWTLLVVAIIGYAAWRIARASRRKQNLGLRRIEYRESDESGRRVIWVDFAEMASLRAGVTVSETLEGGRREFLTLIQLRRLDGPRWEGRTHSAAVENEMRRLRAELQTYPPQGSPSDIEEILGNPERLRAAVWNRLNTDELEKLASRDEPWAELSDEFARRLESAYQVFFQRYRPLNDEIPSLADLYRAQWKAMHSDRKA